MRFKNGDLEIFINFLDNMELVGRASLGRVKLRKTLMEKDEEVKDDQVNIIDEYDGWTDEDKVSYRIKDQDGMDAMSDLMLDESSMKFESPFKDDLVEALENYEGQKVVKDGKEYVEKLSGVNAEIHAELYLKLTEENE